MAPNKTDANGADGLAQLADVGFYREVRVKRFDSMLTPTPCASSFPPPSSGIRVPGWCWAISAKRCPIFGGGRTAVGRFPIGAR